MLQQLRIDPEFEGKIPPLREEELQQLEDNILADGVVINPIIVWDGVIVDGHNRQQICTRHDLPYKMAVFAFDDRTAREIMVPRRDVVTIDIEEPFDELIDEILETRHNRIPVYEESIDNIIGVLHVKDVMIELRRNSPEQMDIRGMLREPYFVPETKEADELFRTMQAERRHMAILVDEYGGFSGIVTIEDLVEEIMGDINEEYEEVVPEIEAVNEDEYRLDGGILIDDVNEELGLKLETDNYDTLSGFLIEKLGHIPAKDDRDVIEEGNLVFTVEEVKDNRITQVSLKILPVSEEKEEEEKE